MATSYLSPGVYVEEVSGGSKPIEGVGTSVAGFIGFTEKGPYNTPTLITNWIQFRATFGDFIEGAYLPLSVYGYFNNGGGICYVVRLGEDGNGTRGEAAAQPSQRLIPARAGTAAGGSLRVTALGGATPGVTVEIAAASPEATPPAERKADGKEKGDAKADGAPGVDAAEVATPRFTLNVRAGDTQEQFQNVSLRRGDARFVETVVNQGRTASKLVRAFLDSESDDESLTATPQLGLFSLENAPPSMALSRIDPSAYIGDSADRTGIGGLDAVDDLTILCAPDLMSAYQRGLIDDEGLRAVQTAMIDHCERTGDRVAILDAPPGLKPQQVKDWRMNQARYDSSYASFYYPWIQIADPTTGKTITVPPSGHIAGVWARVDSERGVHKAPANETIRGCIGIDYQTNMQEQTLLNPVGINCVRAFPGRGIRIWGARTLSSDPEWRYLNVRRLFNFVRSSLTIGMQWAVFEPNDPDLWLQLRRDVSSFLTRIYMTGALFGATDREAFFVKCDSENNTRDTIDAGQVIVDIGIAPTKPAEFVIFRIAQYAPGAEPA
ncbi:MAG: putative phage tail sheath protein [Chloroflexi bacterium]|nr:putative phage tail sheath protein [Chloroflexota bacterium]